jgi:hypothetical protein
LASDTKAGFAPTLPGVTKGDAPMGGKDLIGDLVGKISGKGPGPRLSAGDKVAQAVQLLREAAQEDLRIAPLVNGAIQSLVTGPPPSGPGQPPAPISGPTSQASAGGGGGGSMAALAQMMGGGAPGGM